MRRLAAPTAHVTRSTVGGSAGRGPTRESESRLTNLRQTRDGNNQRKMRTMPTNTHADSNRVRSGADKAINRFT
jgi:hypothetical protein